MSNYKKTLAIAGGSGFVGKSLIRSLLETTDFNIIALSRYERESHHPRLEWRKCDLFSLKDIAQALVGCDQAVYLVHSMLPSAALSQGTFYDFDLLIADNFARVAEAQGITHIVYLGGMIPKKDTLSWHLKSRLEVEKTLDKGLVKVTALRAGLIMGASGSSFTILQRLIERLPILICPSWTETKSQPIDLDDVIRVIIRVLTTSELQGRVFDISGKEIISYKELIKKASKLIKMQRAVIVLSVIPIGLSRFWVSLITGVPRDLVYPLVLSLKHEMIASPEHDYPYKNEDILVSIEESLKKAMEYQVTPILNGYTPVQKDVRSIQRLPLPKGKNAMWVAREYFHWLPKQFSWFLRVDLEGNFCRFYFLSPKIVLLELELSQERSTADRQLLYIKGGLLAAGPQGRGRLEFREVLNGTSIMAAIHEFRPALPWYIYLWTQALVHLWVMRRFSQFLKNN